MTLTVFARCLFPGCPFFCDLARQQISLRLSDPIKAAFGRVARPQPKVEAQALFHAYFFHDLGVRKSAEALPANDVVYLQVSTGERAPLCRARPSFLRLWALLPQ